MEYAKDEIFQIRYNSQLNRLELGHEGIMKRAIKKIKKNKCKLISICNNSNSSIARLSDYNLDIYCGKEISVASTKCYYATISLLYLVILVQLYFLYSIHTYIKNYEEVAP